MDVQGTKIRVEDDYFCLTDMATFGGDLPRAKAIVKNWFRTKFTIAFLGAWERKNNKLFKELEFEHIKKEAGKPEFTISPTKWVALVDATGIYVKRGQTGATYAHKDIAYEFGSAISPDFKLQLIEEYQRLKEMEANSGNIDWNVRRVLCKGNYVIQTDAVKFHKIPLLPPYKVPYAYAEEGDILNLALFGFTAKQWREKHPVLAAKGHNAREYASTNELTVLSNLETLNAEMMKDKLGYDARLLRLRKAGVEQLAVLDSATPENSLRKNSEGQFQPYFGSKRIIFPASPLSPGLLGAA